MSRIPVLKIPTKSIGRLKGSAEKVSKADIVIGSNNVVLKDRHGKAPRPATEEELRRAVQI